MSDQLEQISPKNISLEPVRLPFSFWLGALTIAMFLWVANVFMANHNHDKMIESAEMSSYSLSSYVSDYIQQKKTLVKAIAHHHQERIITLSKGGGFPYDLQEIQLEVENLFPEGVQFAIVDAKGELKLTDEHGAPGIKSKEFIREAMLAHKTSVSIKSYISPDEKYHLDLLYSVAEGNELAGLWIRFSYTALESYIRNFNIGGYDLFVTEKMPPYRVLMQGKLIESAPNFSNEISTEMHDFQKILNSQDIENILAVTSIDGVPWQVRVVEDTEFVAEQKYQYIYISIAIYLVSLLIIAMLILIAKQIQKDQEKIKQDEEHDELFNAGPTVLLQKSSDPSMCIAYVSPNAFTVFHSEAFEMVGQSYLDLIYTEDVEHFRETLQTAYQEKQVKVEMVYRIKDGEKEQFRWIYDYTHIQYGKNGRPELLRGYITCIHAQKMATKNANDLIQSIPIAIFVTEIDGAIMNVNQAAEVLLGRTAESIIEHNFEEWLEESSLQHYQRAKRRYLLENSSGGQFFGTANMLMMTNQEGSKLFVEIGFNKIELNGIDYLIQVVRDITVQTNAQTQLSNAKEQAESLAIARSRFVATISHEIRTPMNGVLGMADLLAETSLDDHQYRYLQAIKQSGTSLLKIINEVLDFAKLDEGHVAVLKERFDLKQLINESVHLLSTQTEEKGLNVEIIYQENLTSEFVGDESRIKQLLMNLLSNAIKFTEKGFVKTYVTEVLDDQGQYSGVLIRVVDSGIGILKKNQDQLFDSFTQADDSTSRKFGGTGLGLAISKQLVTLMGGKIGVVSDYGFGSEFWFDIPLEKAVDKPSTETLENPKDGAATAEVDKKQLNGKNVLIVEDNEVNQKVITEFLKRLGAKVNVAENGMQCLDYWRIQPNKFDLILMDCQMPIMDGFEATRLIRKEEEYMQAETRIPIVALTANVIMEDRQRCFDAGMDDFLSKPVDRDTFEQITTKWVR